MPPKSYCLNTKKVATLLVTLWLLAIPTLLLAQLDFDPDIVDLRLDRLEKLLDHPELTEQQADDYSRETAQYSVQATQCAARANEQVLQAKSDLEILGVTDLEEGAEDSDDAISLIKTPAYLNRVDAIRARQALAQVRQNQCRLMALRADRLSNQANELKRNLSAERLTSRGEAGLNIFKKLPSKTKRWYYRLKQDLTGNSDLGRLRGWTLVAVFALLIPAVFIGRWIRSWVRNWSQLQRGTRGESSLLARMARVAVSSLPTILAGLTLTLTIALLIGQASQQLLVIRVALGILLFGLGRTLINWFTGPGSPGAGVLDETEELRSKVRTRLRTLVIALVLGFIFFGTQWFDEVPADHEIYLRSLLTIFLVTAIIWVIRLGNHISATKGRMVLIRVALMLAAMVAVSAELAGYRNLANFILASLLATLMGSLLLWTALWAIQQFMDSIVHGSSSASYKIRAWLGIRHDTTSVELGWVRLVLSLTLWIGFGFYLIFVWDTTGNAINKVSRAAVEGIPIGQTTLRPAAILTGLLIFALIVTITVWIKARLGQSWLRTTIADRGSRDAVVTLSGYVGFIIAIIVGLTLAGVSFQGLAIVAGALSVGIGFGLQAVVSNFVSGLILLFERPIKAGDFISVGEIEGFVRQIRIRSTEIETLDRQNVIVPNSELISTQVTNWVLRDPYGRLRVPVGVAYGSDIEKVKEILETVAAEQSEVLTKGRTPPPRALFMEFGDSSLNFELRVWIKQITKRFTVTSEINFAIDKAFKEANIEIPFPQRDLHVRSWSEGAVPKGDEHGEGE